MKCNNGCKRCIYVENCICNTNVNDPFITPDDGEKKLKFRHYDGTIFHQPAWQCELTDTLVNDSLMVHSNVADVFINRRMEKRFFLWHGAYVHVADILVDENLVITGYVQMNGWNDLQPGAFDVLNSYVGYQIVLPEFSELGRNLYDQKI